MTATVKPADIERLLARARVVIDREEALNEASALAGLLHDSMTVHCTPMLAGDQIGAWSRIVRMVVDRLEPAVDAIYTA